MQASSKLYVEPLRVKYFTVSQIYFIDKDKDIP